MDYNDVIKVLKKNGYNESSNISDYWFENENRLTKILKQYDPTIDQIFQIQVRWKSEIGQACQKAIRIYIESILENWLLSNKNNSDKLLNPSEWPTIEFSNFSFNFNDSEYTLKDFEYKIKISSHYLNNESDLRGIDLSGISISRCEISNCHFAYANFDRADLSQINLSNCNFVQASFVNARLGLIRMDRISSFNGSNFKNAFLNAIVLNDHSFGGIRYNKITYFNLLIALLKMIFKIKSKNKYRFNLYLKHTEFLSVFTNDYINPTSKEIKRYIEWYMFVKQRIDYYKTLRFFDKMDLIFNTILTKYWTSFSALLLNAFLLILLFSVIYYFNFECFIVNQSIPKNLFTSIYFSLSTFSSFGLGELIPRTNGMQFYIMLEILIGYFILGIFVILITRKLDLKY